MMGYELQYKRSGKSSLISVVLSSDPLSKYDGPDSVEGEYIRKLEEAETWSDDARESEDAAIQRIEVVEAEIIDFVEETLPSHVLGTRDTQRS